MKQNPLGPELVEEILTKLGFAEQPTRDITGLTSLYKTWCRKVPFDNILKRIHLRAGHLSPLPGHNDIEFFQNWLKYGVGGLCWAGNNALYSLLKTLGFKCSRGIATMLIDDDQPPNHGTVAVQFGHQLFLVDASLLHDTPLLLHDNQQSAIHHPAWGLVCSPHNPKWQIRYRPLHMLEGCICRIENFSVSRITFQQFNEITRTKSPFNNTLYVRLNKNEAVKGISDNMILEFTASGEVIKTPATPQTRIKFLVEAAGINEEIISQIPADAAKLSKNNYS